MGKGKKEDTDEMIRQIQETRRQLAASLYSDFFGGPLSAGTSSSAGQESGKASSAAAGAAESSKACDDMLKAPVEAATGPAPKRAQAPTVKE